MNTDFLKAIEEKRKIEVTFNSQSKGTVTRICIPFDFGPSRRNLKVNPDRYHMYDLDSPDGEHTLSIIPEHLLGINLLNEYFEPSNYISWEPNWFVKRDWGIYS